MINQERVKELYDMAVYDSHKERKNEQMGKYYRGDYVGKEMIKSFFAGTIAFILLTILYIFYDMDNLLAAINSLDVVGIVISFLWKYALFMFVYLMLTYVAFYLRYAKGRKELVNYLGHLKKVNKLYDREEKLKKK